MAQVCEDRGGAYVGNTATIPLMQRSISLKTKSTGRCAAMRTRGLVEIGGWIWSIGASE